MSIATGQCPVPDPVAASFALILATCRDAAKIESPLQPFDNVELPLDANALIQMAKWHRILPFLRQSLSHRDIILSPGPAEELASFARGARLPAIANAAEEGRLAKAAGQQGLDVLFVKGATLAHLLYDDPLAKSSWDIDILIDPADRDRGCVFLRDLGYVPDAPRGVVDGVRFDRWIKTMRETTWRHPERGTVVELHVGLSETPSVLRGLGMRSPRQSVSLNGTDVPTLATDELFAYLCVHGTHHGWARLKWLTDVAALIRRSDRPVEELRTTAIRVGAGRCGDVTLLLCHELLDLDLPDDLVAEMAKDRETRRAVDYSLSLIDRVGDPDRRLAAETVSQILADLRNQHSFARGLRASLQTFWSSWNKPRGAGQLWVPGPLLPIVMIVWLPLRVILRPLRPKNTLPE